MVQEYKYLVEIEEISINDYLAFLGYPKSIITYLKQHNDQVLVNNIPTNTTSLIHKNDELKIIIIEHGNDATIPTKMDLSIVYEDEHLLLINKKPHLPVHTIMANLTTTLQNGIKYLYPDMLFHCLSRLDTDTTGLLLLAKNQLVTAFLSKQKFVKEYQAIVLGNPHEGTINKPIYKDGKQIPRIIDERGKHAITHYQTIKTFNDCSLIKLQLETGRTHQIRVHMASIGHPLVGDPLYNTIKKEDCRCLLHVSYLKFVHPITKEILEFHCELPFDMQEYLTQSQRT